MVQPYNYMLYTHKNVNSSYYIAILHAFACMHVNVYMYMNIHENLQMHVSVNMIHTCTYGHKTCTCVQCV